MKVSVTSIALAELDVDLLLVPYPEDPNAATATALAEPFGTPFERASADFGGEPDEQLLFYPDGARAARVALVGIGPLPRADAEALRRAGAKGAELAAKGSARTVAIVLPDTDVDAETAGQALVEGFALGSYRFDRYKTGENGYAGPDRLVLRVGEDEQRARAGAERGRVVAECVMTARDLVNTAPEDKTATALSKTIEQSAKRWGYGASVWDKALIEEEGMGGLLAVNRGSVEPPTFTVLEWQPEGAVNNRPVVLVGKGITFDTGGVSLKRPEQMEAMKADMAGAAAVVGAVEAVARLKLPLYVVGLIPATDNRPGENAVLPGDVLKMHSGTTVEVLNTDAEGRLILADALSYAKTYKPELVIDLATLTGAQVVALGNMCAAVMTREDDGAEERLRLIHAAGERSGDRVHPLPMHEAYGEMMKSDVADLKNVSGSRMAGSITAGKFLEAFIDYPWLHLDIAGPSFLKESKPYRPKGGTGFGVRLLAEFLRDWASPKRRKS